jgi:hypothetical protein
MDSRLLEAHTDCRLIIFKRVDFSDSANTWLPERRRRSDNAPSLDVPTKVDDQAAHRMGVLHQARGCGLRSRHPSARDARKDNLPQQLFAAREEMGLSRKPAFPPYRVCFRVLQTPAELVHNS